MTSINGSYYDSLTAATATSTTTSSTTTGGTTLGQADFLKLLTTQMQAQDPLSPMDNSQMVAQLAQFSSVAGISQMSDSLNTLVSDFANARMGDTASWIGKSALSSSTTATPLSDGSYGGQVTLPSDATALNVAFVDASGNTVHSESLGAEAAGTVNVSWNGKAADGSATTGPLSMVVSASGAGGAITPTVATWNLITGIQSPASGSDTTLITGAGQIAPTDVLSLS